MHTAEHHIDEKDLPGIGHLCRHHDTPRNCSNRNILSQSPSAEAEAKTVLVSTFSTGKQSGTFSSSTMVTQNTSLGARSASVVKATLLQTDKTPDLKPISSVLVHMCNRQTH